MLIIMALLQRQKQTYRLLHSQQIAKLTKRECVCWYREREREEEEEEEERRKKKRVLSSIIAKHQCVTH